MMWHYPQDGDRRERTFFAFLPYSWEGTTYWLVWLSVKEIYFSYPQWWATEDCKLGRRLEDD